MAARHDSYHTALNLLVVANLFASGLLAGGFIWLWLMLPPAPLPDTGGPPACRCPCCTASGPSPEGAQDAASFWPLTRKNNDKTITP
ncbi:hypothetical protein APP83_24110 [Salmonella enterica subsp. enterica serovar Oranienburg]|nr:hypothetical protein [Salmonella enterica subsp. enterica serovar Pomona]EAA8400148.1 hypothetical protein [Salmonella enterica subsp. enterica serovar Oranienburg]EAM4339569.1 hypothetical protein [Salmonella enterica subsp. enterica serovar Minnesota]EAM5645074.1 hypothetical protein [Salmonella enterica]EAN3247088.1 hypothetical protein [Salmonella enterica subsp. enterica serovar Give]